MVNISPIYGQLLTDNLTLLILPTYVTENTHQVIIIGMYCGWQVNNRVCHQHKTLYNHRCLAQVKRRDERSVSDLLWRSAGRLWQASTDFDPLCRAELWHHAGAQWPADPVLSGNQVASTWVVSFYHLYHTGWWQNGDCVPLLFTIILLQQNVNTSSDREKHLKRVKYTYLLLLSWMIKPWIDILILT